MHNRDQTPITIRFIERFYHPERKQLAVSSQITDDIIMFRPEDVIIEFTGIRENEKRIIDVTMPMWLAEQNQLFEL